MWGQGLNAEDKYIHKVKEKLQENLPPGSNLSLHQFAHSAALFWKNNESLVVHALNPFPVTLPPARKPTEQEISSQAASRCRSGSPREDWGCHFSHSLHVVPARAGERFAIDGFRIIRKRIRAKCPEFAPQNSVDSNLVMLSKSLKRT